jgi:hypothetical protein
MSSSLAIVFIGIAGVLFVATIVYLILIARLLGLLRDRFPQLYESLGSPSLILNNTPKNNILLLGWLWRRDFSSLSDTVAISRCSVVRGLLVWCLAGYAGLFALFLAAVILK